MLVLPLNQYQRWQRERRRERNEKEREREKDEFIKRDEERANEAPFFFDNENGKLIYCTSLF